jgi:glycosyltransferase involved in cell wall biosynthesis
MHIGQLRKAKKHFDANFYLSTYPDVAGSGLDPFTHYMRIGWKDNRDPNPGFSTKYYLSAYADVRDSGVNPFLHYLNWGRAEGRISRPSFAHSPAQRATYQPKVSVIVPNYNHARFLRQRIDSILNQTYSNLELLILDDCSQDNSAEIIQEYCEHNPGRVRFIPNKTNSGGVFNQWRKGLENTDGELVWICESDDFCELTFLEHLVAHFIDRSVNIAFGCIQFSDGQGRFQEGLDAYREGAEPGIWRSSVTRPAAEWFRRAFGVNNVIANVGGCVWRRPHLVEAVWDEAVQYKILGDWYLYSQVARGGQIVYEPRSVAYFRQHGANTSVSFTKSTYYVEHQRLMQALRLEWDIPAETVEKFYGKVQFQYDHFNAGAVLNPLQHYLDKERLLALERQRPHILMAFLGFHPGGGELFPISLANALSATGHKVSMLAYDMANVNDDMLRQLDTSIPVYDCHTIEQNGVDDFLRTAGVTVIHSHMAMLDLFFFDKHRIKTRLPYLVTLHGSYECFDLDDGSLMRTIKGVTRWAYTADKNLKTFEPIPLAKDIFVKLDNAMPMDPRPFPKSRQEMGIPENAIVFTFVARGIKRKGWRAAIAAFQALRSSHPGKPMRLLMCGDGEETSYHSKLHGNDPDILFLGYQSCIHGLYRLSDVALVPTRFEGESFPLCIIQALQVGTPVIATRVGEIQRMLTRDGQIAGILVDYERNTEKFIELLQSAMARMLDDERRAAFAEAAAVNGGRYDMSTLADEYYRMYEQLAKQVPLAYVPPTVS